MYVWMRRERVFGEEAGQWVNSGSMCKRTATGTDRYRHRSMRARTRGCGSRLSEGSRSY